MSAALPSHPDIDREEIILTGEAPSPVNPPAGRHFHPRRQSRFEPCEDNPPQETEPVAGHRAVCHLYWGAENRERAIFREKREE